MESTKKTLLLLLAGVLLAGGALWALTAAPARPAAEGESLCAVTAENLRQLQYTCQGQTLTLLYDGGRWTLAEDPAYHLEASACNAMLTALAGLEAQRTLTPVPGEDYGLEPPLVRLLVTTTAGESQTLEFGAENSVTGQIYLRVDGAQALYTLPARRAAPFTQSKEDLFAPFQPAGLTASTIEGIECTLPGGGGYRLQKIQTPDPDQTGSYSTTWQRDGQQTLDPAQVQELLAAVSSYVTGQYTGADLAEYGLDAPDVLLRVETEAGSVDLCYARGTDGCYMALSGDDTVYAVDLSVLETIAAWGRE